MSESDTPPPPAASQLAKHALTYGAAAGVLAVAWSLVELQFANRELNGVQLWLITLGHVAFPIGGITLGIVRWRDRVMGGSMRFTQAFGTGLAVGLVFAIIQGGFVFGFSSTNPGYIEDLIVRYDEQLRASGMTPEEAAEQVAETRGRVTPNALGIAMVARWMVGSLLISLIAALFVRKRVGAGSSRQG